MVRPDEVSDQVSIFCTSFHFSLLSFTTNMNIGDDPLASLDNAMNDVC